MAFNVVGKKIPGKGWSAAGFIYKWKNLIVSDYAHQYVYPFNVIDRK